MNRTDLSIMSALGIVLLGAAATGLCMVLADAWVVRHVTLSSAGLAAAERTDWYKLLRVMGYAPTWLAVGLAITLIDSGRREGGLPNGRPLTWERGPFVMACVVLAGLLAEGVKLLTRRARPDVANPDELYRWISWAAEGVNTGDLALPSSHAAVAFAAAWAVGKLHPRTLPVGLLLAIGCGTTRLLAGQHHASDIVASAFVGLLPAVALTVLFGKR